MTVLFFSRLFYPHIGGVEKHVLEISKLLVKKGYSVTVLTEQYEDQLNSEDEIDGIKIIRINNGKDNWFKKFRVWKNIWRYRKLIKRSDIIHAHDVFFWYLPFRFLYPRKKIFTTFHGYEGNQIPGFKSKLMHQIAEKLSKGNICVGVFLKKWYGTKPDFVTYGAVKIPNSKSQIPNKYPGLAKRSGAGKIQNTRLDSAKRAKYKILFLGRLEEETGIMGYLKALLILKNKRTKFELTILGDGSLRKRAENFSEKNKINASFKGFQKNIEKYLDETDFVFTSRYLGILEAMAAKKIVFAHYNNKIKEDYLKMSPFAKFIIIEDNPQEIANKIEYYLEHKRQAEENVNRRFEWVKNRTWEKVVDIYLKLWETPSVSI